MNKLTTFLFGLFMGIGVYFGFDTYCQSQMESNKSYTTHDTIYDTVPYRMPVAYDSVVIRYMDKELPAITSDTLTIPPGNLVSVTLPVTQKQYGDSSYTAWVSGYEPNLDSIRIYNRITQTTISKPMYMVQKRKRWSLGLQTGINLTSETIQPYIGIGVSYNLLSW